MSISRETKIGIFVVAVLTASFFVINYLRNEDLFGSEIDIVSHYKTVEGLVPSNPVYLKGYKIGSVSDVDYDPESDSFEVTCSINKKFRIPVDSRMTIYSVDLMGGKGIRIDLGAASEYAKNGTELQPFHAPDMVASLTSQISPLISRLTTAVDSITVSSGHVNRILASVNEDTVALALASLKASIDDIRSLTDVAERHGDDIGDIVVNLSQATSRFSSIADHADTVMSDIGVIVSDVKVARIDSVALSFRRLADMLSESDGTFARLASEGDVYNSLRKLLDDADTLVKKIEENPKKYIRIKVF
mgnify:CR=1 FL=1